MPARGSPPTFVPPFPTYPPETAWMREPDDRHSRPRALGTGPARIAYLPADLDCRYAAEHLPDHARLLANIVRWAAPRRIAARGERDGLLDCHLYAQPGRLILHMVNLTSEATWRAPLDELIRVGPFDVTVKWPALTRPGSVRLLVAGRTIKAEVSNGRAVFEWTRSTTTRW